MSTTRRVFARDSALAMFGVGVAPVWLGRALRASADRAGGRKVLVTVFQRGAADGLNIVVPHGDARYYRLRPTIAVPRPGGADTALDLDGFFGLHPSLAPLHPFYKQGHLAIVHAAGSPDPTRSHFDAQDFMEAGTPGLRSTASGWLNRALSPQAARRSPVRAVSIGSVLPRCLRGENSAVAVQDLAGYPRGRFGAALLQIARIIKADIGVEVAFAEMGGWDHHVNEAGRTASQGRLALRLSEFGQGLAAFWQELGDRAGDVVVVTMSEFGRTARENGDRGTDHGHANSMFVLGGAVRGGKVYGKWPGLEPEQLHEGRDLALTTDFRAVLSELVSAHLGTRDLRAAFPGYSGGKPIGLLHS